METIVIRRPPEITAFEFVVLSRLRAIQLTRGCTPRVPPAHKHVLTAQIEVAQGKVLRVDAPTD